MKVKQTRILKRGFTLIEMMVVVAIIGILVVIGLSYYQEIYAACQINGGS